MTRRRSPFLRRRALIIRESGSWSASKRKCCARRAAPIQLCRWFRISPGAHWWHSGVFLAMGRLYAERSDAELAEAALRHASWLDIHDAESLNPIVAMKMLQNRLEAACEYSASRRRAQPDQPRQYLLLSDILEKMGRNEEARAAL